tara:strand:- start:392 stop:754 length:363 start_codon:yes stop_codon:yes gene_type:complete
MAFKLKAPFSIDNTPVYFVNEEEGVLGRANNNGTITVNNKVENPVQLKEVIKHEKAHVDQFKKFEKSNGKKGLNYNDKYVMWNGNKYLRKKGKIKYNGKWIMEGGKSLPWEKEAYKKEKQ